MKRTPLKKRKKSPKAKLKKKTWDMFSKYIRMKHANENGYVKCITCGVIKHWREMQASHYIDGRHNAVLFEEDLVHPSCYACNCILHGNKSEYAAFMYKTYGEERVDELRRLSNYSIKYSISDLELLYEKFSKKVEELEKKIT
uniref:Putative lambda recombination protein n=1 Tax=viral metagenome TaxID=1070528 RepID=A0A6M3IFF5_9ZZZZ